MAFTLSPNLKLRIDSNLTANAKYNLNRLDLLGSTFLVDTTDSLRIRSQTDISIEPNSADIGGSGIGGSLSIGNADHKLESLQFWADEILVSDPLSLFDQASGGSKYLKLQYRSDLNGAVDTASDRALSIDLEGADRELVLGGNYSQLGGSLVLNLTADSNLILPITGTLATLAGVEVFTHKTIDADGPNTISNLRNVNLAANAAVAYSKLNLLNSIVNADVNSAAAIAYSKLNLASSIQNSDIVPAAGIPYSKLTLTNSILNADIVAGAGIPYTKLNLAGYIVDSDIAFGAAIEGTKIDPDFGSQDVQTTGSLILSNGTGTSSFQAAGSQAGDIPYILPITTPAAGQVIASNVSNPLQLEWIDVMGTGTVTSVDFAVPSGFTISGNPITTAGTLTLGLSAQSPNTVWAGPTSGGSLAPAFRALVDADLPNNINASHIADGSVSNTEFQYLDGVTSAIQTQLNGKEPTQTKGSISTSTSGVTVGSGSNSTVGPNVTVDVQTASGSQPGLLSSVDWSTFNGKQNALSFGDFTDVGTDGIVVSGGVGAVIGSGTSIAQHVSDATHNGYLASSDFISFSAKQPAGNYITSLTSDVTASGPGAAVATISAGAIDNSKVSNSAAIAYSKLALTNSIVNADVNSAAAIDYSKLNLSGSIVNADVNASAAIVYSKLSLSNSILNADINASAAIAYSKLNLSASIVNADINASAAIAYSKLALSNSIVNADINASAAIDATKIANGSVSNTEFQYLDGVTSSIQTQLNAKANSSSFKANWITADGTTKTVTHNLGTLDVVVQLYDKTDGTTIEVDSAARTDTNTLTLTSSAAPGAAGWRVLIWGIS